LYAELCLESRDGQSRFLNFGSVKFDYVEHLCF
jgi:hypothetical protein